jgi:hypothetical protein
LEKIKFHCNKLEKIKFHFNISRGSSSPGSKEKEKGKRKGKKKETCNISELPEMERDLISVKRDLIAV